MNESKSTLQYSHPEIRPPRPGPLLWTSAALLTLVALVLLAAAVWSFIMLVFGWDTGSENPVVFVGAVCFPLPSLLILALEWFTLRKRSSAASLLVAIPSLLIAAMGLVAIGRGILGLVGIMSIDPEYKTWTEVWLLCGVIACVALVGFTHLRWAMVLRRAHRDERAVISRVRET